MNANTPSALNPWLPSRATLAVALGLWLAGLALAIAALPRIHRPGPVPYSAFRSLPVVAPQTPTGSTAPEVEVMPPDTIVGRGRHAGQGRPGTVDGVMLEQKP